MSEKKILTRLAEGYGQGEGKGYRPFLEIKDFPSLGRCHLIRNPVLGRYHHLFSDLEWYHFIHRFFEKTAVDWREQFPLDRDVTRAIAAFLGYAHPRDYKSDAPAIVMTTDLVVTYEAPNGRYQVAYSVKYAEDAKNERVKEKLAIERKYWEERGIKFEVFTEEHLPRGISSTGKFLMSYYSLAGLWQPTDDHFSRLAQRIVRCIPKANSRQSFTRFMQTLDLRAGLDIGTHLTVGLHLLSRGILVTNFEVDEIQFTPIGEVAVATCDFEII